MGRDPIRTYFNRHFEAVKDEVRRQATHTHELTVEAVARIDANQAERVDVLARAVDELAATVAELQATNDQLLAVVAKLAERRDGPPDLTGAS